VDICGGGVGCRGRHKKKLEEGALLSLTLGYTCSYTVLPTWRITYSSSPTSCLLRASAFSVVRRLSAPCTGRIVACYIMLAADMVPSRQPLCSLAGAKLCALMRLNVWLHKLSSGILPSRWSHNAPANAAMPLLEPAICLESIANASIHSIYTSITRHCM